MKHEYDETVEQHLATIVLDNEWEQAGESREYINRDFEAAVDMLECKRDEKDYEWMSDIFLPEFPSILLTDASEWVNQYFRNREYTEVKLDGEGETDKDKCRAAKKCLNKTLNRKDLFYFHKYVRGRKINSLVGQVYAVCWWEQDINREQGEKEELVYDSDTGEAMKVMRPYDIETVRKDNFNFDIVEPRNVRVDNSYVYSIQQKPWITIRSETSYDKMKKQEKQNGYINLDLVKKMAEGELEPTKTSEETYNSEDRTAKPARTPVQMFDRYTRFGKIWAVVEERDEDGYPRRISPGYDSDGTVKDKAELVEAIVIFVQSGATRILVRFDPTPFRDRKGNPYKPVIRGWHYIHPTKDEGLSDGKYMRELQVAVNDTFNLSNDRVKLATLPTLKMKKHAMEDNAMVYFEPGHAIPVEETNDIEEFKISDNIGGALEQLNMLRSGMQQVTAKFPSTMGALPDMASTTATAVAGAESRTDLRGNYKSLTFEYTFLAEFYWMILQMTWQFARPETAMKLMGEDVFFFDPDEDYTYTPVSSNIELEYNRYNKLRLIDQFIGRLVNVPNPNTFKTLNYLLKIAFELFEKDFPDYKEHLLDENATPPEGGGQQQPGMGTVPASNQSGLPQSGLETFAREGMS